MKRFYICLGIFVVLIGICFWSLWLFSGTQREMVARLDEIEAAALAEEDHDAVSQMCADYTARWREKEKVLLRVVRHPQLDEISSMTAELRYLATDDSYSHLLAAVERIKSNIEKIGNAEVFGG